MNRQALAAAALLGAFAALSADNLRRMSVTGDEVAHLPAGYTYALTGDMRLNPQHPPLVKLLAGLPLLALDLEPVGASRAWHEAREWDFGREFFTKNRVPAQTLVVLGRLPVVGLGLLLGLVLYRWALELWGPRPALGVLGLFAFCPNLIAHSGLVTTDLGLSTFTVAAAFFAWKRSRGGGDVHLLATGACLGLALLAKYSAVVSVAAVGGLVVLDAGTRGGTTRERLRAATLASVAVALPALLLTRFAFPDGLADYLHGYGLIHADANPRWQAFLWGEHAVGGFWYYYVLAQWWKTPIPALLLFGAALVVATRARGRRVRLDWAFVLLPIVAFHAAAALKHPSIGIRHVLPVFPFLYLACGGLLAASAGCRRQLAIAALGSWYVVGTLANHPLHLSYFNALAGGPIGGVRYLGDSDIDWGQDYLRLAPLLKDRFPGPVRLSAFAPLPPATHGIQSEPMTLRDLVLPEPGVTYVVGAGQLQGETLYYDFPGVRLDWLDRFEPVARAGASLFVFRFSDDPARADDPELIFVSADERRRDAIRSLEDILARQPGFEAARALAAELSRH